MRAQPQNPQLPPASVRFLAMAVSMNCKSLADVDQLEERLLLCHKKELERLNKRLLNMINRLREVKHESLHRNIRNTR